MPISVEWFASKYSSLHGTTDLWVAFSGGVDSRVLLELAYQYVKSSPAYKLQAIHINHGLSKNANGWADHCVTVCKDLNIPLHVIPVTIDVHSGQSIEAMARQARRSVWMQLLPANATLLLAHHAQDQAETILYRLFRGAGPTGSSGMAEFKTFGKGILLRPLLTVAKADINEFAKRNALTWIIDDSNTNVKFDRNFIRHTIIPTLCQRWSKVIDNIIRSGALCAETVALVNIEIQTLLPTITGTLTGTLSISKLLALPEVQCFAAIRMWLANNNCQMPSREQLSRIKHEIMLAKNKVKPLLNLPQYKIRRYRDDLYLLFNDDGWKQEKIILAIDPPQKIQLADGKILKISKSKGCGFILPEDNNQITIYIGSHGEKAKKLFQQYNIPPWQRHQYPLVFYRDQLISIIGLWINRAFVATAEQTGFSISI